MNANSLLVVLWSVLLFAPLSDAQSKRQSPREVHSFAVKDDTITITYGRPSIADPKSGRLRRIWGGVVPYGMVWRTGADDVSTLSTEKPLQIGDYTLPAGTYALFTLPLEFKTSKLMFNSQTTAMGTQYNEKADVARVDLVKTTLDHTVNQLEITVEAGPSGEGTLKLAWEQIQFSVQFVVK